MQSSERWNTVTRDCPDATLKLCFFKPKRKQIASHCLSCTGRGMHRDLKHTGSEIVLVISVITFLCLVPTCHTGCPWLLILGIFLSYFLLQNIDSSEIGKTHLSFLSWVGFFSFFNLYVYLSQTLSCWIKERKYNEKRVLCSSDGSKILIKNSLNLKLKRI